MIWILRTYLALNLLVFWGYTVAFFAAPKRLAEGIGIALVSTTGVADFRAMYEGCASASVRCLLSDSREIGGVRQPFSSRVGRPVACSSAGR
jgi:hypothetical protein